MPGYVKKGYRRKIDVRQSTLLYEGGFGFRDIAKFFGVSKQAVHSCLVKAEVHVSTPRSVPLRLRPAHGFRIRRHDTGPRYSNDPRGGSPGEIE